MIKGIGLVPKKKDISEAQFHRHWREIHGPLALRIKALRRYVQSHRMSEGVPGFDDVPYHGAAEIWFDDLEGIAKLGDNPDYIEGAWADEPNLFEQDQIRFLATREEVVIPGPAIEKDTPLVKAIFLLRRKPGMSVAEFQDYWLGEHAPQIPRDAGIVRYVQCHQIPETYADDTPAYDGVAELSFETLQEFSDYWNSERVQAIFAADAPRFLDPTGCTAFLAEETRLIWP